MNKHCETNTIIYLLKDHNVEMSEPMIFGLASALSFCYFDFKDFDFPFVGGRPKTFGIMRNFCENTGFEFYMNQTTSEKKSQTLFIENIKQRTVGLQLDMFYMPYDKSKVNFGGHTVPVLKGAKEPFTLVESNMEGTQKASLKDIMTARMTKTNMWGKNRLFYFTKVNPLSYKACIKKALIKNAQEFLDPPIKNLGYKGIQKLAGAIKTLSKTKAASKMKMTATIMENGGTGGSLFRNIFVDFLDEASTYFNDDIYDAIIEAKQEFKKSAIIWKNVSDLMMDTKKNDMDQCQFELFEIAKIEKRAFEKLLKQLTK